MLAAQKLIQGRKLNNVTPLSVVSDVQHRVFCGVFCFGSADGQRKVCWSDCFVP